MNGVRTDIIGHVGVLEITRPPNNFFDTELITALADQAERLSSDGCRVLLLCAEGKHFCAGADFGDSADFGKESDRSLNALRLYREAVRLFRIPVPVIAAVQGAAVGGGLGLACAADFRVATAASRFQANFARLGFHPGFGLSVTLERVVGRQAALDMLYTGRRITGQEARTLGLVDRLAEPEKIREAALEWAAEIAEAAPLAVRAIKATVRGDLADRVGAAIDHELVEQTRLWQTEDCERGIAANLARTTPDFVGR